MGEQLIQFLFILIVPLAAVAGALVALFAVGALFNALDHPQALRERIEQFFRRPPRPPKTPGRDHYYRPYWAR